MAMIGDSNAAKRALYNLNGQYQQSYNNIDRLQTQANEGAFDTLADSMATAYSTALSNKSGMIDYKTTQQFDTNIDTAMQDAYTTAIGTFLQSENSVANTFDEYRNSIASTLQYNGENVINVMNAARAYQDTLSDGDVPSFLKRGDGNSVRLLSGDEVWNKLSDTDGNLTNYGKEYFSYLLAGDNGFSNYLYTENNDLWSWLANDGGLNMFEQFTNTSLSNYEMNKYYNTNLADLTYTDANGYTLDSYVPVNGNKNILKVEDAEQGLDAEGKPTGNYDNFTITLNNEKYNLEIDKTTKVNETLVNQLVKNGLLKTNSDGKVEENQFISYAGNYYVSDKNNNLYKIRSGTKNQKSFFDAMKVYDNFYSTKSQESYDMLVDEIYKDQLNEINNKYESAKTAAYNKTSSAGRTSEAAQQIQDTLQQDLFIAAQSYQAAIAKLNEDINKDLGVTGYTYSGKNLK